MQIVEVKVKDIIAYANNPRRNDEAVENVAASIQEFGFKIPIVLDSKNVIVAGHTRVKAARKLKLATVPAIIADDLTPEQIKAFRLVDNKTAEMAEWDFEKLAIELEALDLNLEPFGFLDSNIEFEAFEGFGDGGGSQLADGRKVRIVIGALMFDLDKMIDGRDIYKETQEIDIDDVRDQMIDLIIKGDLL